ncbi:hypothetical protein [Rouxiella chamberiensis]|uniref:hypothetical protein n=1 Tax=Rouxiella chamberiensis TaxID=1513468 RepID=UPI0005D43732|nr:hypothetical protein [Rouxiella chamberiensis]
MEKINCRPVNKVTESLRGDEILSLTERLIMIKKNKLKRVSGEAWLTVLPLNFFSNFESHYNKNFFINEHQGSIHHDKDNVMVKNRGTANTNDISLLSKRLNLKECKTLSLLAPEINSKERVAHESQPKNTHNKVIESKKNITHEVFQESAGSFGNEEIPLTLEKKAILTCNETLSSCNEYNDVERSKDSQQILYPKSALPGVSFLHNGSLLDNTSDRKDDNVKSQLQPGKTLYKNAALNNPLEFTRAAVIYQFQNLPRGSQVIISHAYTGDLSLVPSTDYVQQLLNLKRSQLITSFKWSSNSEDWASDNDCRDDEQ